ncbi:MAG: hypothetical protein ABI443_10570 [Chthoniobacterales bacterium]
MKQNIAVEEFLSGRVVIAELVAHRHKEVQNNAKKVVGIVKLSKSSVPMERLPWSKRGVLVVETHKIAQTQRDVSECLQVPPPRPRSRRQ